jgi:hypothetical protein
VPGDDVEGLRWALPGTKTERGPIILASSAAALFLLVTGLIQSTERSKSSRLIYMKVLSDIAKDALNLPPVQRLVLARILLDLSEDDRDFSPGAEAAWEEEICRRMKSVRTGAARSRSFDQVFADLDRRD